MSIMTLTSAMREHGGTPLALSNILILVYEEPHCDAEEQIVTL